MTPDERNRRIRETSAAIGRRVAELASEHDVTIAALADQCRISRPSLRRRLAGSVPFTLNELDVILDLLCEGQVSSLFLYVEKRHPELSLVP